MSPIRVLVTGAGRGIGRAIAIEFARRGANVAVAARTSSELDAVVSEIEALGQRGLALQMDVEEHGSVEAGVYRAIEFHGGVLDVLVNNAGVFFIKELGSLDPSVWRKILSVNLDGPYMVTREALDGLEESERAHVFNIASTAARQGFAGSTAYCASKYGLRGFGDALREEVGPQGIRVTTIYPGQTDTTIFDNVEGDWDRSKMNQPEDVARVVWEAYDSPADADVADVVVPPPA